MSAYKLQSSDGVIFTVDAATVKQMVTIQTMIDHEDEVSDEVTPVSMVKAQVLEKIIQWTEFQKSDHENTEIAWYFQYFDIDLKKKFEIIIAADYLEVETLLKESCRNVLMNNTWDIIEDAANNFPTLVPLLQKYEKYEVEHGDDVIVTIQKGKVLRYFDTKVKFFSKYTYVYIFLPIFRPRLGKF